MLDYYKTGKSILSSLRSRGYNITMTQRFSWITFYIDGEFLFCGDLQLLPKNEFEEILLEILKEKSNVSISTKVRKA